METLQNEQVTTDATATTEATAETKVAGKRGRPVVDGSKRQEKLAAREAAGGEVKRGRPVKGESKRQQRLAAQEARKAAGEPVKVGRPKGTAKPKAEPTVEATDAVTEAPAAE